MKALYRISNNNISKSPHNSLPRKYKSAMQCPLLVVVELGA